MNEEELDKALIKVIEVVIKWLEKNQYDNTPRRIGEWFKIHKGFVPPKEKIDKICMLIKRV